MDRTKRARPPTWSRYNKMAARTVRIKCWIPSSWYAQIRHYGYVHVPKPHVPHLLGRANIWRKCYEVHPCTEIVDCLGKYQWLTGTSIVPHLPESYEKIQTPDESLIVDFEERLLEYLQMRKDKLLETRDRWWRLGLNYGLFQAVLPTIWQLGDKYPHITSSYWTMDPRVECYWRKHGNNFITYACPMAILYTSGSLHLPVEPKDSSNIGEPYPLTELHPQANIGLFKRSFDQINVFGGNRRHSPYNLAHTLVVKNRARNTIEQTRAHGLMQLFVQSAAQTIQNGFLLDADLHYPLFTQAILTNGREFTFVCYQLNTLNLTKDDPSSLSNIYWIGPTMSLYDSIYSLSINKECIAMIMKFLLNRMLRKGPSQSGFRLAEIEKHKWERSRVTRKRIYLTDQLRDKH